ncbi:hypothetical protein H6F67_12465 [Microcoleus sp. FACHB-1515]|uniref:hypothetical protein n=1 Tax=Cyanophyceae TaxID=3028117 RepID=UPI001685BDC7|nr:hypothetical protein [Microcoleus sp. FACHB-1515]MBD2090668.1 hypothetical protein [Microcoleus sp. FACHB-1515]
MAKGFKAKPRKQSSVKKSRPHKSFSLTCESEAKIQLEIEAFLAQDLQENPEHYILAWQAGVYNPVAGLEVTTRFLEANEEDWLFLAKEIGWLQVEEDELDAIYFTAPPPDFDPDQADWYVRPDIRTWLEEPERLSRVVAERPVPHGLIFQAIERYIQELGWDANQSQAFIQKVMIRP